MSLIPIDVDFAGTTDASGKFTSAALIPATTVWGALKITAQTQGSATSWAVLVAGMPKAFSRGARIDVPVMVQPGQGVQVVVTGAQSNSPVTGKVHGVGGSDLQEVSPFVSLVPNTISVDTTATSQLLGTITALAAGSKAVSFTLPPGTQAIGFVLDQSLLNQTPTEVQLVGDQTTNVYLDELSSNLGLLPTHIWAEMVNPNMDSSVTFQVFAPAGGPATIRALAWFSPAVVLVRAPPGENLSVDFSRSGATAWQLAQSAKSFDFTANTDQTLIAAPGAGLSIYVLDLFYTYITQVGAGSWQTADFRSSDGSKVLDQMNGNHGAGFGHARGPVVLPVNNALLYHFIFGTATGTTGHVLYTVA
jgi:hypothetical protein